MLAAGFTRLAPAAVKTADTLIDRPISNPVPAVTRWNLLASPPSRRRRGRHFAGSVAPRANPLLVLLSPAARSCDSAGRPVATHPRLSNSSFGLVSQGYPAGGPNDRNSGEFALADSAC